MTVTIENTYTGNGSTTDYSFTFPYLDTTDIKVSLGGSATTAYSLLNATTVRFDSAPTNSTAIRIYRDTAFDNPKATFYPGSAIRANDLNDNTLQNLYVSQEANVAILDSWRKGDPTIISTETWAANNTQIATTGSIDDRIDEKIDTALTADVVGGQSVTVTDNSPSTGKITVSVTAGSIRTTELNTDAVTGAKIADEAIDSEHYTDGSIDHEHLSGDCIDGDNIQDDVINSEHIAAGALDTEHYANASIDSTKLTAATIVTNSEQSGASVNDTSFFTTLASDARYDARYFNVSTGDTIKDGDTSPDNDTTIATTAAINDRIIDLVEEVGGFVAISSENAFPNANPDVNDGAGTIVSIKALSENIVTGGGVTSNNSIAQTVGGTAVNITGLTQNTTYAAGFGMLVETTTTLNEYTFHRLTPKATEVTTVAGNNSNISAVANNINAINTVNSISSAITTVNSNSANINAVAGELLFSEDLGSITGSISTGSGNDINTVANAITNINTVAGINANITTVAGISSNVTSVAGISSNVTTVAGSISDVNRYANEYKIASSAPGSPSEGDLWYDSTNNVLKYHNGSGFIGISTGLTSIVSDTSPALGGHLDCNDKNLTEVGTVSGDNLQMDFGTLS